MRKRPIGENFFHSGISVFSKMIVLYFVIMISCSATVVHAIFFHTAGLFCSLCKGNGGRFKFIAAVKRLYTYPKRCGSVYT
jgi:hypothetical protein